MNKKKLKVSSLAGNAKNEINYAAKRGKTIKAREGAKLLSTAGKALKTVGAAGKAVAGAGLVLGGLSTAKSLYDSLRRGEGYAKLLKIGKKKK